MTDALVLRQLVGDCLIANSDEGGLTTVKPESICKRVCKVGLFFSTKWCPDSRWFTPKLITHYKILRENAKLDIEVIFVSTDYDVVRSRDYFSSMPWFAVDFKALYASKALASKFKVERTPTLIIIDCKTGQVLEKNGVAFVQNGEFLNNNYR